MAGPVNNVLVDSLKNDEGDGGVNSKGMSRRRRGAILVGIGKNFSGMGTFRKRKLKLEIETVTRDNNSVKRVVLIETVGNIRGNNEVVEIESVVINTRGGGGPLPDKRFITVVSEGVVGWRDENRGSDGFGGGTNSSGVGDITGANGISLNRRKREDKKRKNEKKVLETRHRFNVFKPRIKTVFQFDRVLV